MRGEGGMDANEVDDADDKDGETVGVARELVVDLLQSVVEIVTYGYRQDPQIFEYESVDAVVSFPFYTEAPRFAQHEEKIIQTAILL
ncbi:hypothetical protein JHK85_027883 [Glycine max]|nr:hypothetical protein JHK85_027883 [Glycine max]